jgi:HAD superfamily phosphoserine phosphatase-like hydrolase
MSIGLVLFDMDGVIFEGKNFWLDLHREYGTAERGLSLSERYLAEDYDSLARAVVGKLWKGRSAAPYWDLVYGRAYQPGVQNVFAYLHKRSIRSAIVSSGPAHLAERAQRELGIDAVRANRLFFDGDRLSGEVEVQVRDSEKLWAGRCLMDELGVPPDATAFVGDSNSDVALAETVRLPVAYDSTSKRLVQACCQVLKHGELPQLINFIHTDK